MRIFGSIGSFFLQFGKLITKGLKFAVVNGLTEEIVKMALPLIAAADLKFGSNVEKRNWVIAILVSRGVPEGVARVAVELALLIYKKKTKA